MVEVIAGIAAVIVVLGVLFGVPRAVGTDDGAGTAHWPDVFAVGERGALAWLDRSRIWDLVLGIVTVVIMAAAIMVFQDPAMVGEFGSEVTYVLGILGFAGVFASAYLGVRRAEVSSAEAALIAGVLVGVVLLALITYLLIN